MLKIGIRKTFIGAALLSGLVLSGCANSPQMTVGDKTKTYAGVGALLGGVGGLISGDDATERRQHGTIGAAGGAIVGAAIGQYFDRQEAQLQQNLAGSGIGVSRPNETTINLNLPGDITFPTNSSAISGQFYGTLDQLAYTLTQYPNTRVVILGHTDNRGSYEYNQSLSEQRALSVANYLMSRGVANTRIATAGRSYAQPIADNFTPQGQSRNRRVDIQLTPLNQG
ncbi:MAG: OmpA family protein [Alphaproteobacteria bacterium]